MNFFKHIPLWSIFTAFFALAALYFRFALKGYSYLACTMGFFGLLVVAHHFLSSKLWHIILLFVCIGFVYFIIVEIPIIKNAQTDKNPERDYLIVLGAALWGDEPSPSLVRRLDGACRYLKEYPDSKAIVSGGQGNGENRSEADAMFQYLTERGIEPERIIKEDKATSTKENLLFSFEIIKELGDDPVGNTAILSSPYHLFRAKSMSRALGVEAAGVAGDFDCILLTINHFIREAFGVTHFWVFGW